MSQTILPIIPNGSTPINDIVSVFQKDGEWTYFLGCMPIYSHPAENRVLFRLIVGQLISTGNCRPSEIIKTFGVSKNCVLRAASKYDKEGLEGFFPKKKLK